MFVVYSTEGLSAFFRSLPTTLAMNVPFGSVVVATNELLKMILIKDPVIGRLSGQIHASLSRRGNWRDVKEMRPLAQGCQDEMSSHFLS